MFVPRNRQEKRPRRPSRQQLTLEVLEDRTLLSTTPTTILDLNGLTVDSNKYSSTDILVQFQGTPGTPSGPAIAAGTTLGNALPLATGFYQVNLNKGMTVDKALAEYQAEKGVLNAEPDYELSVSSVPNDPLLSQQWALNNTGQDGGTPGNDIHAEQAWNVTTGSPNVVVAVLDTGVDYNDTDLAENIWINQADIPSYWYTKSSSTSGYNKIVYKSEIKTATPGIITMADLNNPVNAGLVWKSDGNSLVDAGDLLRSISQGGWEQSGKTNALIGWNFVNNNNNPMDENGHGTNVAGILGADGNNGTGVAGVDWHVQIMPVEFMGANGEGSVSNFIQALNFAVQNGAKITNNSWEGAPYSAALYDAFLNAQQHGVICVTAAGNEGSNNDYNPDYPASLSTSLNNVVAVAATTNTDQLASFSNYGPNSVALAAPGVNILSTLPDNQYGAMSGTSMATPEVAGAMALVWGEHPSWSYNQVINRLLGTTQKLPSLEGKVKTGGLLDLAAAVGYSATASSVPTVTSLKTWGPTSSSMAEIVLTFNEAVNIGSFSSSAVTLTNPNGVKIPVTVQAVSGSGNKQIELTFANQTMAGTYHLSIYSSVTAPYQTTITLQAPSSSSTQTKPTVAGIKTWGPTSNSMQEIVLTFNAAVNVNSFSSSAVTLTNPNGVKIPVAVQAVSGSGNKQIELTFANQTMSGTYHLSINSSVTAPYQNTITIQAAAAKTYISSAAQSIKPNSSTVSTIWVPAGTVSNVEVRLNVNYPADKDLYIYLVSPTGKTIALDYNRGGWSANLSNTLFSDQASTPIADAKAPSYGTYRPDSSLSQLKGTQAGGNWRLAIRNYGIYSGALQNWSLILTTST
jgi:serine protease